MRNIILILISLVSLSGCNLEAPLQNTSMNINQSSVCEVSEWQRDKTANCTVGQKIVFLPDSWGNAQLPILFATVNCDHRFAIALTEGGVSCIYLPTM